MIKSSLRPLLIIAEVTVQVVIPGLFWVIPFKPQLHGFKIKLIPFLEADDNHSD